MATSSVNSVGQTQSSSAYTSSTSSSAGSTDVSAQFMTLLMAQLKNQNPLEPMDDSQLLNQMTSLNTLSELKSISEKIDNMAKASQSSYAASLIGKTITAADDAKGTVSGVVTSMQYIDGQYSLAIGSQNVALDDVIRVAEA
jgi:flagellar hook assembly protein FlgD